MWNLFIEISGFAVSSQNELLVQLTQFFPVNFIFSLNIDIREDVIIEDWLPSYLVSDTQIGCEMILALI